MDGGYNAKAVENGAASASTWRCAEHPRSPASKYCHAGGVVEHTFGWRMLHRRLTRDYETRQESSRAMIHWSIIGASWAEL